MPSAKTPAKSGRPAESDSLRSRIERGEAQRVQVALEEDLYRGLKIEAARTDRTLSDLVGEAVRDWLARHDESREA